MDSGLLSRSEIWWVGRVNWMSNSSYITRTLLGNTNKYGNELAIHNVSKVRISAHIFHAIWGHPRVFRWSKLPDTDCVCFLALTKNQQEEENTHRQLSVKNKIRFQKTDPSSPHLSIRTFHLPPADQQQRRDVVRAAAAPLRAPLRPPEQRGAAMPRRRRNLAAVMANRLPERPEEEEEPVGDEEAELQVPQPTAKIGAKKQKKLEEKQAKKAQREAEMEEREERKRMQELREQEKRQEEERERRLEQKREEDERRAKEEQERREEEEYMKLKASFIIEDQGEQEQLSDDQSRSLLQDFIGYIQKSKVVLLEDLASHFGMRTQDAIARLQDLLAEGTITGVIDDRGKFIFITPEELDLVAQFIRQRGRVSITELAQASNSLINLMPES